VIKTANIREKINDGLVIDITVKNNKNHVLAPTWDIVLGLKNGRIGWNEYKRRYINLLYDRLEKRYDEFLNILKIAEKKDIVLVCFCADERYCHRILAKEFLEKLKVVDRKDKKGGVCK